MVVMWRREVAGTVQSDPERSKSDLKRSKSRRTGVSVDW